MQKWELLFINFSLRRNICICLHSNIVLVYSCILTYHMNIHGPFYAQTLAFKEQLFQGQRLTFAANIILRGCCWFKIYWYAWPYWMSILNIVCTTQLQRFQTMSYLHMRFRCCLNCIGEFVRKVWSTVFFIKIKCTNKQHSN